MKLGFSLKKTKRTGALLAEAKGKADGGVGQAFASAAPTQPVVEKVFVTDFDPHAAAVKVDGEGNIRPAVVIPLIKANEWAGADANKKEQDQQSEKEDKELTADELAAKKVLEDVRAQADESATRASSTLVIPMDAGSASAPEKKTSTPEDEAREAAKHRLFNFEAARAKNEGSAPQAPILRQNVVPGMDELNDVNEKYRHDVSLRPDALDVHSDAYERIPIEDFGAALLRGMGWKGNVEEESKDGNEPKPRHKLLGLGATMRPKLPGESKNKHKSKKPRATVAEPDDDKPRRSGLNHTERSAKTSRESDRRRDDERSNSRSRPSEKRSSNNDNSSSRHRSVSPDQRSRRRSEDRERKRSRSRDRERRSDRDRDRNSDRRERSRDRDRRRDSERDRRDRSRSRDDRKRRR